MSIYIYTHILDQEGIQTIAPAKSIANKAVFALTVRGTVACGKLVTVLFEDAPSVLCEQNDYIR